MSTKLEQAFDNYIKNYDLNNVKIKWKYYHSYKVKELMKELSYRLDLTEKETEVAEVIGLLHDIGRFEQIRLTNSFSDIKNGIDHADESCVYLFDQGHIKDFYDDEDYYEIIKDAIKNHNKLAIDDKVTGKNLLFSKMIRDMDKVDIYRVLSEKYSYEYDKDDATKEVLDSFNNEKSIDTKLLKTRTDRVYSFLAFIYDINFKESFNIFKENNCVDKVFPIIKAKENSKQELEQLINKIKKYIDKKIETI